jgi:hypothetical protein
MLPMLRACGVRFIQVARGGQAAEHGYDVLADSLAPAELIRRGAWHLGQEMDGALTLPRIVQGKRECTARAKGEVLDAAIADEIAAGHIAPGFRHVIAYAAEEMEQVARDTSYTTNARTPWHPLVEMGQDRNWCDQYLYDTFGFRWPRSCCVFCPFQASSARARAELAERWRAEPASGAQAVYLERRARSLNSRMKLFGRVAAADVVREHRVTEVTARVEEQLAATEQWTVVEIRRVYRAASVKDPVTGKSIRGRNGRTVKNPRERGDTWRSIRPHRAVGTREEALALLTQIADGHDTAVWTGFDRVPRAEVRVMPDHVRQWPITTHEFSIVAGPVAAKQRDSFDDEWDDARRQERARGGGISPLPLVM